MICLSRNDRHAAAYNSTPANNDKMLVNNDKSERFGSLITTGITAAEERNRAPNSYRLLRGNGHIDDMIIADHVDSDASSWASENYNGGDPDPISSSDDDPDDHFGPDHGLVDSPESETDVDPVPRVCQLSVSTLARADLSARVLIGNSAHSSIVERIAAN